MNEPVRVDIKPIKITDEGDSLYESFTLSHRESPLPPRELTSKIQQQIAGLGENADAIARSLALEGVKGEMGEAESCALAAYVQKHFGDQLTSVDVCSSVRIRYDEDAEDSYDRFSLTPAAVEFIAAFDHGQYPDLVE